MATVVTGVAAGRLVLMRCATEGDATRLEGNWAAVPEHAAAHCEGTRVLELFRPHKSEHTSSRDGDALGEGASGAALGTVSTPGQRLFLEHHASTVAAEAHRKSAPYLSVMDTGGLLVGLADAVTVDESHSFGIDLDEWTGVSPSSSLCRCRAVRPATAEVGDVVKSSDDELALAVFTFQSPGARSQFHRNWLRHARHVTFRSAAGEAHGAVHADDPTPVHADAPASSPASAYESTAFDTGMPAARTASALGAGAASLAVAGRGAGEAMSSMTVPLAGSVPDQLDAYAPTGTVTLSGFEEPLLPGASPSSSSQRHTFVLGDVAADAKHGTAGTTTDTTEHQGSSAPAGSNPFVLGGVASEPMAEANPFVMKAPADPENPFLLPPPSKADAAGDGAFVLRRSGPPAPPITALAYVHVAGDDLDKDAKVAAFTRSARQSILSEGVQGGVVCVVYRFTSSGVGFVHRWK